MRESSQDEGENCPGHSGQMPGKSKDKARELAGQNAFLLAKQWSNQTSLAQE
jgi:hypothetical protein